MALRTKDRVLETSITTGTGTYTLAGAATGFQAFIGGAVAAGDQVPYYAEDGTNWEVGIGNLLSGPNRLERTTVLSSSNAGAAVNWGAGARNLRCGWPASLALPGVVARTADTVLGVADHGKTFTATGTWTQTLTAAATLGDGWWVRFRNDGSGVITIDPNGAELINGAATIALQPGESRTIVCNGTAFKTFGGLPPLTANGVLFGNGTGLPQTSGSFAYTSGSNLLEVGTVSLTAGAVGAPSIYLGGDTTTGPYRIGANNVGFAISGTKLLDLGAASVGVVGDVAISGGSARLSALGYAGIGNSGNSTIQLYVTGSGTRTLFLVDGTNGQPIYSGTNSQTFSSGESATASALFLRKDSTSSRSLSAAGTLNASGADYAEYERKRDDCGAIEKGQIVGFDVDGRITDKWALSVSFGIKSTNPSYVGGDAWGTEDALGLENPRPPQEPGPEPLPPKLVLPPEPEQGEDVSDAYFALLLTGWHLFCQKLTQAHELATQEYETAAASWKQAKVQYESAMQVYEKDKALFDAALEGARQTVDRIAYSGKVPVNVQGANPGDYIIAAQEGAGIGGAAVAVPSFDQYKKAVGRVRRVLPDGRAEVAVIVH